MRGLLCMVGISQIGIFLELIGAFILVVNGFKSKKKAEEIKATNGTNATYEDLARASFRGFVFLGLGLILQFVSGFC